MSNDRKALIERLALERKFREREKTDNGQALRNLLDDVIRALSAEPSPDAAQGGAQGEVVQELVERIVAQWNHSEALIDEVRDAVGMALAWYRQNRAPHPSQAGAEAVDEGMVSVPRELVLRARNELQRLMACIESNEEAAYVERVADDLESALSRLASK